MNRITALAASIAVAAGSLTLATPSHAAPAQARSYTVTAKANTDVAIGKEDVLTVRGKVTPRAAGEKVVLQQRVLPKRTWRPTDTATIRRNGTYKLQDDPSTPGTREYRVLKPASRGIAKGFSKTLTVEVYSWQKLARRTPVAANFAPRGVTIGTEYFGESLATGTPGTPASIEYTLGRKCTQLRATFALTDDSASGSSGAVTVSADGTVLGSHALSVGTIVADEVLDLTGVFRIKFDATTSASPAATVAVATPEVLCTR